MPNIETPVLVAAGRNSSLCPVNLIALSEREPGTFGPFGDVVNSAQRTIYRSWRRVGLTHNEALHQAEQFARHFQAAA